VTIPEVVELARALVRAPSPNPPGDERAVAAVLQDAIAAAGLPRPSVVERDPRRPNLVTTLDFGPGGRHLVLSGHIDTKPVGDARWSVDPFAAEVDGDRLYGLGSGDMKAGVAAMVVAAARLAADPPDRGRLSLALTADEEDGAAYGAHHLASTTGLEADGIVIGEPGGIDRDFDRLHLVSRGIARLRLIARGAQGHSSLSGEPGTRNAGVDAARAAVAVADGLERDLEVPDNPGNLLGWRATVNTAMAFRGGVGYGVLPGAMAVDTEVRLLPGMSRDQVRAAFERRMAELGGATGADLAVEFDAPPSDWLPAASVPPDGELACAARDACTEVFGAPPPDSVFPGTTDATWFSELQHAPTLPALGPGLLRRAHGADEWVSVAAVHTAVDLYTSLARSFCAAGRAGTAGSAGTAGAASGGRAAGTARAASGGHASGGRPTGGSAA
jgi:acetylornithine deacetylase/succinyl-diaminopimelate desuccinylase-like protein